MACLRAWICALWHVFPLSLIPMGWGSMPSGGACHRAPLLAIESAIEPFAALQPHRLPLSSAAIKKTPLSTAPQASPHVIESQRLPSNPRWPWNPSACYRALPLAIKELRRCPWNPDRLPSSAGCLASSPAACHQRWQVVVLNGNGGARWQAVRPQAMGARWYGNL